MGHKPQSSKVRDRTPAETDAGTRGHGDAEKLPVNIVERSRCKKCGSVNRAPYFNVRRLDYAGVTPDGRTYKQVVWRRTRCLDCGQYRDDKSYE
jgi:hypothetical protein